MNDEQTQDQRKQQPYADLTAMVVLKGTMAEVDHVYETAGKQSRNVVNKLNGEPFTEFGEQSYTNLDDNLVECRFSVTRKMIRGNHANDIIGFISVAIKRSDLNVEYEVTDITRSVHHDEAKAEENADA